MSIKIDPLALYLDTAPKKTRVKPLTLEDTRNINEEVVQKAIKKTLYQSKYSKQIDYLNRFREKGLCQINLFIKKDYRDSINSATDMIRDELISKGMLKTKMNRHLVANIIIDYYMLNNPEFEKSIKDAVFGIEEPDQNP